MVKFSSASLQLNCAHYLKTSADQSVPIRSLGSYDWKLVTDEELWFGGYRTETNEKHKQNGIKNTPNEMNYERTKEN